MITGDFKNRLDQIWNALYGTGMSDTVTVLDQITYLMFIKLLDDNQRNKEATANSLGTTLSEDQKTFPDEGVYEVPNTELKKPYKELRWSTFHNYSAELMYDIVAHYVFPFIKGLNKGKGSAFSKFMASANFAIQRSDVLSIVVSTIDSMNIDMNENDVMGDVYEYLIDQMGKGQNGQFRTPRHIVRLMVELMKPTLNDNILDPAMGTAGFLIESASYISNKYHDKLMNTKTNEYFKSEMFTGFDTNEVMLRIGAMNLMLHDIDNPNVQSKDSLEKDNHLKNKYSLILANPPFSGGSTKVLRDNINPDLLAITSTTKTELLFIALFVDSLKVGGRCACIVPEGVLFGSDSAHKAIKKELVNNQCLRAVISMPKGVFKPYAGVSTAVIIFDKTNSGGTDKVWFYEMKADGFSLDDKREPITDNDIPDIIARYGNPDEENRTRKDQSFFVPKDEIVENDYDLTINKYKETDYVPEEYPEPKKILADIKSLENELAKEIEELEKLL